MTIEERYLLFERRVDDANKILEERYKYLYEKPKKKYRIDIKMIEYHLNIIVVMKRLNHVISESNVRKIKNSWNKFGP